MSQVQEVVLHLEGQLRSAIFVRDQAWSYGCIEGLKTIQDHVLKNPQADLRALDHLDLLPSLDALEHYYTVGKEMLLDAFPPNSDAPNPDPNTLTP